MATADDYAAWIVKNADKKGTPDFEVVAKAYQDAKSGGNSARHAAIANQIDSDPISQGAKNFAQDMPWYQQFAASYGKAVPDLAMGAGQRLGLVDQKTVDERKALDAPLMKTGWGKAGNIAGNVMAGVGGGALLSAATPALPLVGQATVLGGAMGAAEPTAQGESATKNALTGAALGGGSVLAGQALGAGYRGLKAIAEPFTAAGPQRIAGRTLQRFAEDPSRIQNVTNQPTITGARQTLAEQTADHGLARLQDSLRSADPQINNAIGTRLAENNAARVNALQQMAGKDGARDFAVAERQGTAGPMYQEAFNVIPDAASLTAEQARTMQTLLKSPAIKSAMKEAQAIAANRGTNIGPANATGSIEGLHNMKEALDGAISVAKTAGDTVKADSIKAAQKRLVALIEDISPEYANARGVYAQMSKPINQMDVVATVAKKGLSKGSDLSGNQTINRNALISALSDEPALVRQATGRNLGDLSKVMEPEQINLLKSIASEADRAGAVATAGNGPGSATAQRLASQNILRQVITPGGTNANPNLMQRAGQAVVDNTLANTLVGKATNWIYSGIAEPKIQNALTRAVLNPEEAKAALAAAQQQNVRLPDNLFVKLLRQARQVTGVSANSARQP